LLLSSDPLTPAELADATQAPEDAVRAALAELAQQYAPGRRGIRLRELGGGFALTSDPDTEEAARRLLSRPRLATLTPAQAEALPDVARWDPSPEEHAELRERLLRAGEARAGDASAR